MAFINPSLKKNQGIIASVWGTIVRNLTNDLKYVIDVSWCQSIFTVFLF